MPRIFYSECAHCTRLIMYDPVEEGELCDGCGKFNTTNELNILKNEASVTMKTEILRDIDRQYENIKEKL